MKRHVTAIYFSPTGTSRKGTRAIAKVFDEEYTNMDITMLDEEVPITEFGAEELVVFGAPVYSGRLFQGSVEQFRQLKGDNTPCVITVTYGNRHYDDALLELSDLVKSLGFVPIAAAALVGEHTYGEIQLERPNEDDIEEDEAFAKAVIEKLDIMNTLEAISVPGNSPYKDGGTRGKFRPSTLHTCTSCGLCARKCPAGAIDKKKVHVIDEDKCISCFRCIKSCRMHAKVCDSKEYVEFAKGFTERLRERRENLYIVHC